MDKTLSGKPNIMTTALRLLYRPLLTLHVFYIIILTPLAKKKVSGRQSVAIDILFLHAFGV